MNTSLNLYHIFYTVAKCGNLSAAAKKLYISQPAVSKAISKLEGSLTAPLFIRSSRGVKLTESGEILYRQLDVAFHAIYQGEEQIRKNEALGIGTLSIGVSTTLCKYVLLPYLQEFIRQNPHIRISIYCQSTYETIAALENGSLDVGLVGESDRLGNLNFRPLQKITDIFVTTNQYRKHLKERTGTEHRLTEKAVLPGAGSAEKELLSHATLLLLNKSNITRQYIDRYLILQDITIEQQIEVSTMELLIDFAKIGLGIACVIKEFVNQELKDGSLVEFNTDAPIPSRQIGLAYKALYSPAVTKFLSLFPSPDSYGL